MPGPRPDAVGARGLGGKRWTMLRAGLGLFDACPPRALHVPADERNLMSKLRLAACAAVCISALAAPGLASAAALPNLDLSVTSSSMTVSGATVSGAVNIVMTAAKGLKEPTPVLVRLNPGATEQQLESVLTTKGTSDPNYVNAVGSIVFDAVATPGGTTELQTELQPGNYVALNVEGEKPKTIPHSAFTVTPSAAPAVLPTPAATVKTIEFSFTGPSTLKVGELVRFENEGFLVHMDFAFPVKSRSAGRKALVDLKNGNQRALEPLAAGEPVAFFGPISTGGMQQGVITARPGWYVEACFMETQDGRDHTRLGMERLIHIVK